MKGWRLAGEALLLIVVVIAAQAFAARGTASGPAPALSGVTLDGQSVSLETLHGQPVLVHFWATWCPICVMEQGSIDALARHYQVVTVAEDDATEAEIRHYLDKHSVQYPVLHDARSEVGNRWGVRGVPASFVIDPRGRIVFREVGYTTGLGLRMRMWWASL